MFYTNRLKIYSASNTPSATPVVMPRNITIGRRLWPRTNVLAAVLAWQIVTGWALLPAVAQSQNEVSGPAGKNAAAVDWSDALRLHRVVEGWVRNSNPDQDSPESALQVTGVLGVRVTLRWSGITMGFGSRLVQPRRGPQYPTNNTLDPPIDLVPLARLATHDALRSVNEKLLAMHRRAISAGTAGTDSKPTSLQEAGPRLQVDLQIAHSPRLIVLEENEPSRQLYRRFVPGYHGLRLTRSATGTRRAKTVWMWPANALAANMSPRSQLVRMLADLGYGTDDMKWVARPSGLQLSSFEVIHMVQPGRGLGAMRLVRGNSVLPTTSLSSRSLDEMAQRLASFLIRRQLPDGRLAGTYHPSTDRYHPEIAPMHDMALAVFVLARRVAYLSQFDPNHLQTPPIIETLNAMARLLADELGDHDDANHSVSRIAATALMVMALESPHLAPYKRHRDRWAAWLLEMCRDDGSLQATVAGQPKPLNRPTQALVTAALASLYEQTRDERFVKPLTQSLDFLCQDADASALFNMLPWLAMAQSRLQRLGILEADAADPDGSEPRITEALMRLADTLRKRQVSALDVGEVSDVVGGFDWVARSTNGVPDPNWRSAHVLTFLASLLGQRGLVPRDDAIEWLLDCGLAGRFLAQLMFDESSCYYVRSRDDALGGVRRTLWDNRLSNGPTAMTLLAVTELQESVARLNPLDGAR